MNFAAHLRPEKKRGFGGGLYSRREKKPVQVGSFYGAYQTQKNTWRQRSRVLRNVHKREKCLCQNKPFQLETCYRVVCGAAIADCIGRCAASEIATLRAL